MYNSRHPCVIVGGGGGLPLYAGPSILLHCCPDAYLCDALI